MKRTIPAAMMCLVLGLAAFGQNTAPKTSPDPEIQKMIREVSSKQIETYIRKLVSFGTRNTLSEQNNPTRGIGAARDGIYGEFQKISSDCGGCLNFGKQSFLQAEANRIPEPTTLTDLSATLSGTANRASVNVDSG